MNRRQLIKGIGAALCAGAMPPFLPGLVPAGNIFLRPLEAELAEKALTFQEMLNLYLPLQMIKEEIAKPSPIFEIMGKGRQWTGGSITIPIKIT